MACSSSSMQTDRSLTPTLSQDAVTDSFKNLLTTNGCSTESDHLSLAVHELMTEAGFKSQGTSTNKLPADWKNGDMYRFNYIYENYEDVSCSITAMVTGRSLLVTGTLNLDDSDDTYHIKLKTVDYINDAELNNSDKNAAFKNLCRLSHRVRHSVVLKMANEVKKTLGLIEDAGLQTIPLELKLHLITYLDVPSVYGLSRVSRDLHNLCNEEEVSIINFVT